MKKLVRPETRRNATRNVGNTGNLAEGIDIERGSLTSCFSRIFPPALIQIQRRVPRHFDSRG